MILRYRFTLILTLLCFAGSVSVFADPLIIPKEQSEHFCQLLIDDGNTIAPLNYHARRAMTQTDSLSVEQLFTGYIFFQSNWKSMRFFPHCEEDGSIRWYAPEDRLPSTLSPEHQKYIREVFPRLEKEIQAGNWETVDAYIDKMIEYQCEFGGHGKSNATIPTYLILIGIFLLLGVVAFCRFISFCPNKTWHR